MVVNVNNHLAAGETTHTRRPTTSIRTASLFSQLLSLISRLEFARHVRERVASKEGRKAYEKRKVIIEPPFGNLKHNVGIRQFRLRGLEKVDAEYGLMCIGHNLKKIWRTILRGGEPAWAIA